MNQSDMDSVTTLIKTAIANAKGASALIQYNDDSYDALKAAAEISQAASDLEGSLIMLEAVTLEP